jgi:predicted transcriptional regulator
MPNDEVQLGSSDDEDYEVVPVGPIRKLERRIDEIQEETKQAQNSGQHDELVRDVLDIMKSNQKIVNDMTESTHELKNSVEDLTHKMDEVVDNMNNFMDLLNEASEMDMEGEVVGDIEGRLAEAIGNKMDNVASDIQQSNQEVVSHLEQMNESIRKSYASQGGQSMRPSGNQASQGQGSMGGNQQNQNMGGGQSGGSNQSEGLSSDQDERMKRLKEKFGKMSDE